MSLLESNVKKVAIIWIIILSVTSVLMLFLLLTGERSLNWTLGIFMVVIRFLAGFGTTMSIGTFVIFVLTKFGRLFEGEDNQKRLNRFLYFAIFILIVLMIYQGPYKIITSILPETNPLEILKINLINFFGIFIPTLHLPTPDNILDIILYVYGIASLILTVYIIPLIKDEFFVQEIIHEKEVLKRSVKKSVDNLKTRILSFRKKYTELEVQKQVSLKDRIEELRRLLAIFTLIFLGIGCLVFIPLSAVVIFMWLRIYLIYTDERPHRFEEILLIVTCSIIMAIALLLPFPLILELTPFYKIIQDYYFFVYISQFAGLLIASILYIHLMLKPIREAAQKKKFEDLKKEKGDLEKSYDDLQKEKKKLEKEKKKMEKEAKKLKSSKSK